MRKMLVSNLEAMRLDKKATFVKGVNYISLVINAIEKFSSTTYVRSLIDNFSTTVSFFKANLLSF